MIIFDNNTFTDTTLIGSDYSVFKVESDIYHAYGVFNKGQAGVKTTDTPTSCTVFGEWKKVVASNNFTAGIKTDNTLWAWGSNEYGQLGIDPVELSATHIPVHVMPGSFCDVAIGDNHLIAVERVLQSNNKGLSGYNILGLGDNASKQLNILEGSYTYTPFILRNIKSGDAIEHPRVVAGGNNSAFCLNTVATGSEWYVIGDNSYYQLGSSTQTLTSINLQLLTPATYTESVYDAMLKITPLRSEYNIKDVYISRGYIIYKDIIGSLYGRGRNDYGQLSVSLKEQMYLDYFVPIDAGNEYKYVSCATNRVVAIDTQNRINTWGVDIDTSEITQVKELTAFSGDEYLSVSASLSSIIVMNIDNDVYIMGDLY